MRALYVRLQGEEVARHGLVLDGRQEGETIAMAKYLGLLKISKEEAARVIRDGPSARRDSLARLVKQAGGELDGAWYSNVGDWDLICIIDMDDESPVTGAAATLARRAAGLTSAERWIELADIDQVTEVLHQMEEA